MTPKDAQEKIEPLIALEVHSDAFPFKKTLEDLFGLVFLPLERKEDGRGIYGQSSLTLVKELKVTGVNSSYLDSSENRTFEVKKSIQIEIVNLVIYLAQEATKEFAWNELKQLLKSKHPESQKFNVTYLKIAKDEVVGFKAVGQRDDVFQAIDKFI